MTRSGYRYAMVICAFITASLSAGLARGQGGSYINFETIPNRALALSPNGTRLFVTNPSGSRLHIFAVSATGVLTQMESVQVGLEPIAVAARSDTEVWVVNHVSDSVSVVNVAGPVARVVRTLLVGDEPRDIAFAGPNRSRAFITASRRGQNHPADLALPLTPEQRAERIRQELVTPGLGRADVWVFDALNPGNQLGGRPLAILQMFGDKPSGLAVSPNGATVYANIFNSGNESTTISALSVCGPNQNDGPCMRTLGMMPGGVPAPNQNQVDGTPNPLSALVVQLDRASGSWRDVLGRDWRNAVRFELLDNDVFQIDAMATPPRLVRAFQHVGTLNFGMAVHPTNGRVYVANTEARNVTRFVSAPTLGAFPNPDGIGGAARTADPANGKTLNGHLYESRVTILDPGGAVRPRHLNKHINYEVVPSPPGVRERSVASPHSVTFSPDGNTLYVAALGSNKIARFQTSQIDADTFVPSATGNIQLTGLGPTEMVIGPGNRGFVYNRLSNTVATVDLGTNAQIASVALIDPEPAAIKAGRRFFYDSTITSTNGEANCNVCHPSGDKDDLSWDLGAPFFGLEQDTNPRLFTTPNLIFNPLKGALNVITLRGINDHGPMFWRGDRTNAADFSNERANFATLNIVFPALLGRQAMLTDAEMSSFTNWALSIVPPPNPVRNLNNVMTPAQQAGFTRFTGGPPTDGPLNCIFCHSIDPAQGFFGTAGRTVNDGGIVNLKVCHLRNVYDKVGMFGRTDGVAGTARTGPQIRGSGNSIDGSSGSLFEFSVGFAITEAENRQLNQFLLAFPTNLAPIVGQQVTLRADSGADIQGRIGLMMQRCQTPFVLRQLPGARECDLIAKGIFQGNPRGFLMLPDGNFQADRAAAAPVSAAALLSLAAAPGGELTFTAVYPGGGRRLGIDRNSNGLLDFDERQQMIAAAPAPAP